VVWVPWASRSSFPTPYVNYTGTVSD